MERVQAQHRLRGPLGDDVVDPPGAVGGDVGQLGGAVGAEVVEEPPEGLLRAVLPGPDQSAGVVIDHAQQVALALALISSIPIRRSPASRSIFPARSATTRVMMSATLRQA